MPAIKLSMTNIQAKDLPNLIAHGYLVRHKGAKVISVTCTSDRKISITVDLEGVPGTMTYPRLADSILEVEIESPEYAFLGDA